jgi:hypothetical protein
LQSQWQERPPQQCRQAQYRCGRNISSLKAYLNDEREHIGSCSGEKAYAPGLSDRTVSPLLRRIDIDNARKHSACGRYREWKVEADAVGHGIFHSRDRGGKEQPYANREHDPTLAAVRACVAR